MSADSQPVDWRRLREFADVDLTKSFVLSWHYEAGTLFIDVDLLLLPDHPFYETPRPAEKVCIRPAIVEFPFCDSVSAAGSDESSDISAVLDQLEIGSISGLQLLSDGCYEMSGDFGVVRIEAERPLLKLKSP